MCHVSHINSQQRNEWRIGAIERATTTIQCMIEQHPVRDRATSSV
jgi:hypothetical protein